MLTDEQQSQIPRTTIDYWKRNDHKQLYGFEWVKGFYTDQLEILPLWKSKTLFSVVRMACRVYNCYAQINATGKGLQKKLRENADAVVEVIDRLKKEISLKVACKWFNITTNQYYRWKNNVHCSASVLNLCYKTHPGQLSTSEVQVIDDAINDPVNSFKKMATMYYGLVRDRKLFCSLSSFYKYCSLIRKHPKYLKQNKQVVNFKARRLFEYLHIDTTFVQTQEEGKRRVVFIKDNYSKAILNFSIVPNGKSDFIKQLIVDTFQKFRLFTLNQKISIVSDGGSENKGQVIQWVNEQDKSPVEKITAKSTDFQHTNNSVESAFNTFKNEYLHGRIPLNKNVLYDYLWDFYDMYNYHRYPVELYGYAPMEIVNGAIPDPYRFKSDLEKARKQRLIDNKGMVHCKVCL